MDSRLGSNATRALVLNRVIEKDGGISLLSSFSFAFLSSSL
jgi:hypothetical protein